MTEELQEMIRLVCDRCEKEDWKFDMTFTYDKNFW